MLHEFLDANREELVARCRAKVRGRTAPRATEPELQHGIPLFLAQLTDLLQKEQSAAAPAPPAPAAEQPTAPAAASSPGIDQSAASHGGELQQEGFTVDQVVHDYGDLCQAVTELAVEQRAPIDAGEFRILNLCLDNAIAGAVTEYSRRRDRAVSEANAAASNERLGFLAHELRNRLTTAILAVDAMKRGQVGLGGATGAMLDRSLLGLRDLIDHSLAEVRLNAGLPGERERLSLAEFLEEAQIAAALEARLKDIALTFSPVAPDLWVLADHHLLSSAVTNLLQNAFKFTPRGGHVSLTVQATAGRIRIAVQDQCGGLPPNTSEELFRPFTQRSGDHTGVGLGLSISRRGVEELGGTLGVRDLPGIGCVFTIDLPRAPEAPAK